MACVYSRPLWGESPPKKKISETSQNFDETEEPEARGWMTLTKILVSICLYCLNYTKFGKLFLRKIIKIVATRCQILRLKCTEFDFGWGSAPDPAGELTALPGPLAGLKGAYF